ncbi:hypothetical protein M885DRAFT_618159 [Pelagophyceae sp. CCMP2097]|nr:hypothetical protein M885DRAFT_618159 [Pelagophyceae sp. CCMP2097]
MLVRRGPAADAADVAADAFAATALGGTKKIGSADAAARIALKALALSGVCRVAECVAVTRRGLNWTLHSAGGPDGLLDEIRNFGADAPRNGADVAAALVVCAGALRWRCGDVLQSERLRDALGALRDGETIVLQRRRHAVVVVAAWEARGNVKAAFVGGEAAAGDAAAMYAGDAQDALLLKIRSACSTLAAALQAQVAPTHVLVRMRPVFEVDDEGEICLLWAADAAFHDRQSPGDVLPLADVFDALEDQSVTPAPPDAAPPDAAPAFDALSPLDVAQPRARWSPETRSPETRHSPGQYDAWHHCGKPQGRPEVPDRPSAFGLTATMHSQASYFALLPTDALPLVKPRAPAGRAHARLGDDYDLSASARQASSSAPATPRRNGVGSVRRDGVGTVQKSFEAAEHIYSAGPRTGALYGTAPYGTPTYGYGTPPVSPRAPQRPRSAPFRNGGESPRNGSESPRAGHGRHDAVRETPAIRRGREGQRVWRHFARKSAAQAYRIARCRVLSAMRRLRDGAADDGPESAAADGGAAVSAQGLTWQDAAVLHRLLNDARSFAKRATARALSAEDARDLALNAADVLKAEAARARAETRAEVRTAKARATSAAGARDEASADAAKSRAEAAAATLKAAVADAHRDAAEKEAAADVARARAAAAAAEARCAAAETARDAALADAATARFEAADATACAATADAYRFEAVAEAAQARAQLAQPAEALAPAAPRRAVRIFDVNVDKAIPDDAPQMVAARNARARVAAANAIAFAPAPAPAAADCDAAEVAEGDADAVMPGCFGGFATIASVRVTAGRLALKGARMMDAQRGEAPALAAPS